MDFKFIHNFCIICTCLLFPFNNLLFAQNETSQKTSIDELIENIAENTDDEIDYTRLYEDLNYFLNNPINLNSSSKDDLEKLFILTDFQIQSLLDYIKVNGGMLSIYELQLVHGFSMQEIEAILPFVRIADKDPESSFKFRNALKFGTNQVFMRGQKILEEQTGYSPISDSTLLKNPNSRYLGDPYKLYVKYKYNYKNNIYWGLTAEKDPGEEFFRGNNKNGFDYYSAYVQVNNIGILKTITLGDFEAKFGQGLVLEPSVAIGKSSYVLNVRKKSQGIKKYSSSNENKFFRGIGTSFAFKDFELSGFYSNKKIDANIVDSIGNSILSVSSFQNTGSHSIPSEITDKHSVGEEVIGGNLNFNHSNFKIGVTALYSEYSAQFVKDTNPENQFDFRGKSNSNISIDYQFTFLDINFFGEEAISKNGGNAFINGVLLNPASQVSLSILHRLYQRNYQSLYGNTFSESSGNSNESGLYIGMEVHPVKHWMVSAYFDSYKFPWLKSGVDAPSSGYDWVFQADYIPTRNLNAYVRVKYEDKLINQGSSSGINKLANQTNLKVRMHIGSKINEQLSLKSRIETSKYTNANENPEYGYVVYQDVFYSFKKVPLAFNLRFAIFDTDTYNSRIYAYESDILYSFSIPAYYSKGTRTYINLKYAITNFIDLWLRYSQTYYSDLDVISSGLTQINGNTKSEMKVQIRIKL